jgi:hypothetical protein
VLLVNNLLIYFTYLSVMSFKHERSKIRILIYSELAVLLGIFASWLLGQTPLIPLNPVYWIWWFAFIYVVFLTVISYAHTTIEEMYEPRELSDQFGKPGSENVAVILMLICFFTVVGSLGWEQRPASLSSGLVVTLPSAVLFFG